MGRKKQQRARKHHDSVAARRRDRSGDLRNPAEATCLSLSSNSNMLNVTRAGKQCEGDGRSVSSPSGPLTLEICEEGGLAEAVFGVAAGRQKLEGITKLALVIDSSKTCVEGLWATLPRLHTLVLDGSRLVSFRDLGVDLRHLNTLSLESSGVEGLDGIGALPGLRELQLAHNRVFDVTPLACHGNLQALGLRQNRVSEVNSLDILSTLPMLYSLDLQQNPLMESLKNLPDGNERGVVHKLIPQIRILNGVHLFNESERIDVETLNEAVDFIYQGASRARAVWAEEDASTDMSTVAAVSRGVYIKDELPTDVLRRRPRRAGVLGAGVGAAISPVIVADHAMVGWDSDLTQGGGQAFSGNPSSAIRRHKLAREVERQCTRQSPTRVLDTLDLAKMMERGLKQRQTHLSDKVSEWRREAILDPLSHGDPSELHEELDSSALRSLSLGETSKDRFVPSAQHRMLCTDEDNLCCDNHASRNVKSDATGTFSYPYANKNKEGNILQSGRGVSHRPWTTGQFERSKQAGIGGQRHELNSARVEVDHRWLEREHTKPGEAEDIHQEKRRPQTASVLAQPCDGEEPKILSSWQTIWKSLQTSRIAAAKVDALAEDVSPVQPGQHERADRLRRVDFRRQRRARKARRRSEKTGDVTTRDGGGSVALESNSASEDDADSSDGSAGAENRDVIKRRAADLANSTADWGVATRNSSKVIFTPRAPVTRNRSGERRREGAQREKGLTGGKLAKFNATTTTVGAPCRSLLAIDDVTTTNTTSRSSSSSEDECDCPKAEGRRRAKSFVNWMGGGVAKNGGDDGEGSLTNPGVSSLRASRRLGFDLKKSLAAIDEWTEQVTSARDDCGAPHQATAGAGQSILVFVQEACEAAAPFCAPNGPNERQDGKEKKRNQRANPDPGRRMNNPVGIAGYAKISEVNLGREDSDDDGSQNEVVLSVAAARVALGISKTTPRAGTVRESAITCISGIAETTSLSIAPKSSPSQASLALIDTFAGDSGTRDNESSERTRRGDDKTYIQAGKKLLPRTTSGLAVAMSDEALEGMLRRHPRTVPELRTKESFRRFFQGMEKKRMSRLLRGAYEGTLPADEADRKVKKRLRLVGDVLASRDN